MQCVHCNNSTGINIVRRGLCWRCYRSPAIRQMHEAKIRRGPCSDNHEPPMPAEPIRGEVSQAERAEILAGRVARGEGLWHPADWRE